MISAIQQLFYAERGLGSPQTDAEDHEPMPCAICGGVSARGHCIKTFITKSLTDQNTFRCGDAPWVCEACAYVRGRFSPVPGRPPKEGKESGGRFGNFSHFMDGARYENASKGEKPKILSWLRGPKQGWWFCVVADSGQKHLLPYAQMNPPGARGVIRFEEQVLPLPRSEDFSMVDEMIELLTAGATKEELASGDYTARGWSLCGDAIRAFEEQHGGKRGGAWFSLAVWLAQRNEERVAVRLEAESVAKRAKKEKEAKRGNRRGAKRTTADASGGGATGVSPRVPANNGRKGARALAHPARQDAGERKDSAERRRVVDGHSEAATDSRAGQLDMFAAT